MFKFFHRLLGASSGSSAATSPPTEQAVERQPDQLKAPGAGSLDVPAFMPEVGGFPMPGWDAILKWVATIPDETDQAQAWLRLEFAWLQRLQLALGPAYTIRTADNVALLSSLDDVAARATLAHVSRSRQRVLHTLKGVAQMAKWGLDILVVFDDHDTYYHYAGNHYPDEGEFAFSSGMYINAGCGHFIVVKNELLAIEPTIVHELTHACLSHLPIPVWLNEGLAVNTEHRFYPQANGAHRGGHDAKRLHRQHQRFWSAAQIQHFWSGDSFTQADEGNALSYDLGRILTTHFASGDWPRFAAFANAADRADGGASAAQDHLGLSLGQVVCALLEREYDPAFEPDASRW